MRDGWKRYLALADEELKALRAQQKKIEELEAQKTATLASAPAGNANADAVTELSSLREKKEEIAASLTASPQAVSLTPRIYIHIREESRRAQAAVLAKLLYDSKFVVPGIERLSSGPRTSELRYFRRAEEATAEDIANLINRNLPSSDPAAQVNLVYIPGHEDSAQIRQNHFELWLAPG